MKNDLESKKKLILALIKLKKDNYGENNIGIFSDDIKQCGLEKMAYYYILLELEKEGFITDLEATDLDGGIDTGNGWAPWFAVDYALFPGLYTFKITDNFDELYKNLKKDENENILVLVGKGKSTLTRFFIDDSEMLKIDGHNYKDHKDYLYLLVLGLDSVKWLTEVMIQTNRIIIHLQSEDEIDKLPKDIKEKSIIFKINI